MAPKTLLLSFTSVLVVLTASCGHRSSVAGCVLDPRDTVNVPEWLSGEDSLAYIENALLQSPISADDLLNLAEVHNIEDLLNDYNNFEKAAIYPEYAKDFLATGRDSAAMCLENRILRMYDAVSQKGNAPDMLQWAVAVNTSLDEYCAKVPSVARDSALVEAERVIARFSSLTQYEMNFQSYVSAVREYYSTIEAYRLWLEAVPSEWKPFALEEYEAWHDLNEARFALWCDVSYQQEWYSMKPMEIEAYYEALSINRRAELAIERDIILRGESYCQKGKTVSTKEWEDWIAKSSVPEDMELLQEMESNLIPDEELVKARVAYLRTTFSRWLTSRQAFAAALPRDRGMSYDNLTADIHSRMIGTLDSLYPYTPW